LKGGREDGRFGKGPVPAAGRRVGRSVGEGDGYALRGHTLETPSLAGLSSLSGNGQEGERGEKEKKDVGGSGAKPAEMPCCAAAFSWVLSFLRYLFPQIRVDLLHPS
jgi:hypothetical protein